LAPEFLRNRKTVALILVIAALALSTPLYITYNYYQNDPKFCTSCHLMNQPYELWRASAMHDVTCHNCHELSPPEAMNLVFMTVVENPTNVTTHAEVDPSACVNCHTEGDITIPQITDQIGHEVHYFQGNISCLQCHGTSLHEFTPPDSICQTCHNETQKTLGMASLDCKDCHTYTATGKISLIPQRIECLSCHSERATVMSIPAAAHQDSSCSTCHQVHNSSKPLECTSCHPRSQLAGLHQITGHNLVGDQSDCQKCHVPHQQNTDVRQVCTTCHYDKVDHNPGIECNLCHNFAKTAQ
jgi:nitrate/TMAO reductase-like tetraheme cytochrome c subunit